MSTLTWADFEPRLAAVLASLPDDAFLIIAAASGSPFVQFVTGRDVDGASLGAQLSDSGSARLSDADQALFTQLGFGPDQVGPNWVRSVAWPVRSADLAAIARAAVLRLHAVGGVADSADLRYWSWRHESASPGVRDLELPALGLVRQQLWD